MANRRLSATVVIGGTLSSAFKSAIGSAKAGMADIGRSIDTLKTRQRDLNNVIKEQENLGAQGSALKASYAQQELATIGKQIDALRRRQKLEQAIANNQAQRAEIRGKIGSTVATAAIAGATVGAAVKEAADFDYQLQLIGNTANMTKAEIADMRSGILRDSKLVGQSANDMQRGMGFLIAAGMDINTARAMLGQIGKTATATGGDIEDLAKAAFTLNDTLGIKPGAEMTAALDTLAQAGKEGNVELKEMAKQLPVLGAGFQSLKMGGREAAATMAAALEIARKGAADADEAANNMKNFIAKVMSPETLKKAKKNFGIDLYKIIQDAQTQGQNPFEASMQAIIKATKGDQKAIGELFGDMQVQNFLRPMIQQWDEYKRIKDKALKSDGVIEKDFALMMETTKVKMMELANAAGRFGIALGAALSAASGNGSFSLADKIDQVTEFINANKELVGTSIKVVGGLFAMRLGYLGLAYGASLARGAFLVTQAAFAAAPAVLAGLGTALSVVATGLRVVALAAIANPVGAVVAGLAAGAVLVAAANWETVVKVFRSVGDVIGSVWGKTKAFFGFGNSAPAASGMPAASAPPVPSLATARGGATSNTTNTNTFNITQQPGQDQKSLADEIMRRMAEKQAVQQRGRMYDMALGY